MNRKKEVSLLGMLKPVMMFTGTWKLHEPKSTIHWIYWLYGLIFQGVGLLFVFLVIVKFIEFVKSGADSADIIPSQVFVLSTFSISVKVLIYQFYKVSDIIKEIMDEEKNMWRSGDHQLIAVYQEDIKYIRKWNWGTLLSSIFTAGTLMSVGVASFVQADKAPLNSDSKQKEEWNMFPIWLPYRESDHRVLVVALKCIFTFVCASLFVLSCLTFLALMIYSVGLLKIQQAKIRKCNWVSYNMAANPSVDMKALIMSNAHVFGCINRVDKCVRYVLLVDVALNSINIASLATYLSHVQSGDLVFCTCFLLLQIAQVLVLGWFANDIKVQSLAAAADLYNMNWHYLDFKNKKTFLMVLMQHQQCSVISIGPFGPMTVQSVISVIKAAYSYMMVMRTYK